ncbi:hypothetical protein [Actinomadura sp. 7K507]|uniref:hypothetical protein n=1 Tax=Actinomadura sp. 7K507 TaxID=2530365 RepID=UPI00104F51D9|nr:hypothetical protein [Actinomadura sp. 7K507]TDC90227.1 hypothetical protein E1285_15155 [Actinomadura sp. 7K507]
MTIPYPITSEKTLGPAGRGGVRGIGRRRRAPGELPPVKGEQVRVFLVDGEHVVDHGRPDDDEQAVRASHVAVVDLSRNVEVPVRLTIPSCDAQEFTVQATFLCSVTDAAAVVQNGQGDASRALTGYVRSHQRLFQLGLDHRVSAINHVRLLVQTQLQAYVQLRPPVLPGIAADLASVDVLTPDAVRSFQNRLNEQDAAHTVQARGLNLQHEIERIKEDYARQMEIAQRKHDTQMEEMRLHLQEQTQRILNSQINFLDEAVGDDPLRAAYHAQGKGELSAVDVAHKVQEQADRVAAGQRDEIERSRRLEDEDRTWMRQHADREYEAGLKREERAYQVENGDRERLRALEQLKHELDLKKLEHLQALESSGAEHERAMIERAYAAEERERERLHEFKGRTLDMQAEQARLDHQANEAKLQLLYAAQGADREHRHAFREREQQQAIDREIREHELRRHLLQARLEMFKEYAARGYVDQGVISQQDVLYGLTENPPVTGQEPRAALQDGDSGDYGDYDESTLREEGSA